MKNCGILNPSNEEHMFALHLRAFTQDKQKSSHIL